MLGEIQTLYFDMSCFKYSLKNVFAHIHCCYYLQDILDSRTDVKKDVHHV